jgi:hypothetical protein
LDEHNRIRLDANGIPFLWSHPVNEVRSFPPAAFFFFCSLTSYLMFLPLKSFIAMCEFDDNILLTAIYSALTTYAAHAGHCVGG